MHFHTLRWRFTLGFIVLQLFAIAVSFGLVFYAVSSFPRNTALPSVWLVKEITDSVHKGDGGEAVFTPSPALAETIEEWPTLWFAVELPNGSIVRHGEVPPDIEQSAAFLSSFRSVEMRGYTDSPERLGRAERVHTDAGEVMLFAGGASMTEHGIMFWMSNIAIAVPAAILAFITLIGVPWVTRWSLRSLNQLTDRLEGINYQARGSVVEGSNLPGEMRPVVDGINMALRRLDDGFETTERFFVNAAHELRTPVAILQVRIDTLAPGEEKQHLQRSMKRLTTLAHQLLELENYRQKPPIRESVELEGLVSKVVADLAPFAIAEGYEISFDSAAGPTFIQADEAALERAFTNLIRNAIQYAGGSGEIAVRILEDGSVSVGDEGPGIPSETRALIFEPFFRVSPHGSGAGLGLSMVRQIVESHGGAVQLASHDGPGSTFVVSWAPGAASFGNSLSLRPCS